MPFSLFIVVLKNMFRLQWVLWRSELVANQINGVYRVRDGTLKSLEEEVRELLGHFTRWQINYIPREDNREADRLAREAVRDKVDQVVAGPKKAGSEESPSSKGQDGR